MAQAHLRDYAAKAVFDDAIRALDALVEPDALHRLSSKALDKAIEARDALKRESDAVVRAWD